MAEGDEQTRKFELQLSPETRRYILELFQSKDEDGSGNLNLDELDDCLREVGFCPTEEDVEFLKKYFDKNGDGKLQITELIDNLHIVNAHSVHGADMMEAFKVFDINGDGYIRLPEMLKILTAKDGMDVMEARKLIDELVREFDKNFDGKFDYPEFVEICMAIDSPLAKSGEINFT